jgi:hypothetical protein
MKIWEQKKERESEREGEGERKIKRYENIINNI